MPVFILAMSKMVPNRELGSARKVSLSPRWAAEVATLPHCNSDATALHLPRVLPSRRRCPTPFLPQRSPSPTSVPTPAPSSSLPHLAFPLLISSDSLFHPSKVVVQQTMPISLPSVSCIPTASTSHLPLRPQPARASVRLDPSPQWPTLCFSPSRSPPINSPPDLLDSAPTSLTLTQPHPLPAQLPQPLRSTPHLRMMTQARPRPTHPLSHLRATALP